MRDRATGNGGLARRVGNDAAPRSLGASHKGGQTGRHKKCGAGIAGSAMKFSLVEDYAAAAFLAALGADLGAVFFVSLALSFAANSCLTFDVIAATSTL